MKIVTKIAKSRVRRTFRVRNQVRGSGRLWLSVFRSNKHMYAQIIDDAAGKTLVSASTREPGVADGQAGGNKDAALRVGRALGARAIEQGIKQVCFDRGPYKYHGRVAALAAGAREAGLDF